MTRIPDWHAADPSARQTALNREAVIRPLSEAARITHTTADSAAQQLGISRSLVYRLVARFRCRPQTSTLLPQRRGHKPQTKLLDPRVEKLLADTIQQVYLQRERPRISDLMRAVSAQCYAQGYAAPNYRTIRNRLKQIDLREQVRARDGYAAARSRFAPVRPNSIQTNRPLACVQVDHTEVDVMVVDERERKPIGRPWLTLAIDLASRAVLGLSLSLEPPSTVSVALVLTHAVLPKELWLADRSIDLAWPMHGIPDVLHFDNAPEFHSEALRAGAEEYGIQLAFRPPATPHWGGHIERLIGTTMGAVHLLPGSTGSSPIDKGTYSSERNAALSMTELERWLVLQIAGIYHQRPHSAIGKSPLSAWNDASAEFSQKFRVPLDHEAFFVDFLPGERRLVRRDGIQLFGIRYWDSLLSPIAGRSNHPVLLKYDPRNLSRIWWRDQDGRYWPIPYRDLGRPPISLWEQREAAKRLKAEGRRSCNEKVLFETILAQRSLVQESRQTTRQRRAEERRRRDLQDVKRELPKSIEEPDNLTEIPLLPFAVEEWE